VDFEFTVEGKQDGHVNMARDIELLELAERGRVGCRVYDWNGPWVTLGCFQSPERDLVDPAHTNWVIRPTGGKAVLHGHDVTVGMALPLAAIGVQSRSLRAAYRIIIQPFVAGLRACGVPAKLAEETRFAGRGSRTADCFAFSSPNDVVDETTGLKVCGCALKLTDGAVLVQASLPNGRPLVSPATIIRNAALSYRQWDSSNFAPALESALRETIAGFAGTSA